MERCTGAACTTFATIATLASNAANYTDLAAVPDALNRYRVSAVNVIGSTPSNIAEVNVPAAAAGGQSDQRNRDGNGPRQQSHGDGHLDDRRRRASRHQLHYPARDLGSRPNHHVGHCSDGEPRPGTFGNDTGAKPGTTYWYRVVANYTLNGVRISNPSNVVGPVAVP